MALGVGIDLVDVDEVRRALDEHGERYLEAVFTDVEREECAASPRRLAERFAAKEAAIKALRCDERPPWHSIEVVADAAGRPRLRLSGDVAALAAERGSLTVSIARAGGEAMAVVLVAGG